MGDEVYVYHHPFIFSSSLHLYVLVFYFYIFFFSTPLESLNGVRENVYSINIYKIHFNLKKVQLPDCMQSLDS